MARGTIIGMIWGAVVSAIGAGTLSVMVGSPERPAPDVAPRAAEPVAATPEAPAEPVPADPAAPVETTAARPEPEPPVAAPDAEVPAAVAEDPQKPGRRPPPETAVIRPEPPAAAPEAPAVPETLGADTAPPSAPAVGQADTLPTEAPSAPAAGVSVTTEAPSLPSAQAAAPGLPAPGSPDPTIAPDQPPPPPVPAVETALEPDPVKTAPEPVVEAPAEAPAPAADNAGEETAEAPAEAAPALDNSVEEAEEAPAEPVARIGEPVRPLTDRGGAVSTRLPRIGAAEPADAPSAEAAPDTPLARFAAASGADVPADLPRLSVILIDDGKGPLGPEALRAFPFPLTFALDPSHPDAAQAARAYRDLGFEVVALAEIPEGAAASDVEVALAAALDGVPEAVAVLEGAGGGLTASRDTSTQAAVFLAASGHGLLMQPRGLNTAQALAAREGVPAATLFRDFDGEGQDAGAIRRALDNAALRARQEGAVVMLGRLRADTVSALVLWGLQDRSGTLALVPVSTVLRETAQ